MTDYVKKTHTTIFTGLTGYERTHLVLDLIEREHLTTLSSSALNFDGIKRTMPKSGSKMMIRFSL